MKLFINYLFLATLSSMLTQANTDSSSQNTQAHTKKVIEEIPTFENAKFDEAIFN